MMKLNRALLEGLGLSVLALLFSGALLYAAVVAASDANYLRSAAFGLPGALCLFWAIRFTRSQLTLADRQ